MTSAPKSVFLEQMNQTNWWTIEEEPRLIPSLFDQYEYCKSNWVSFKNRELVFKRLSVFEALLAENATDLSQLQLSLILYGPKDQLAEDTVDNPGVTDENPGMIRTLSEFSEPAFQIEEIKNSQLRVESAKKELGEEMSLSLAQGVAPVEVDSYFPTVDGFSDAQACKRVIKNLQELWSSRAKVAAKCFMQNPPGLKLEGQITLDEFLKPSFEEAFKVFLEKESSIPTRVTEQHERVATILDSVRNKVNNFLGPQEIPNIALLLGASEGFRIIGLLAFIATNGVTVRNTILFTFVGMMAFTLSWAILYVYDIVSAKHGCENNDRYAWMELTEGMASLAKFYFWRNGPKKRVLSALFMMEIAYLCLLAYLWKNVTNDLLGPYVAVSMPTFLSMLLQADLLQLGVFGAGISSSSTMTANCSLPIENVTWVQGLGLGAPAFFLVLLMLFSLWMDGLTWWHCSLGFLIVLAAVSPIVAVFGFQCSIIDDLLLFFFLIAFCLIAYGLKACFCEVFIWKAKRVLFDFAFSERFMKSGGLSPNQQELEKEAETILGHEQLYSRRENDHDYSPV